jgi:hypothetical protein
MSCCPGIDIQFQKFVSNKCFAKIAKFCTGMAKKFIFTEDIESVLKQGKTEIVLAEGTRFSPAARDLIREKGIQVFFTDASYARKSEDPDTNRSQRDIAVKAKSSAHGLIAVTSSGRDIAGPVGKTAIKEPFYLIFDNQGRYIDVIKNPYSNRKDVDP